MSQPAGSPSPSNRILWGPNRRLLSLLAMLLAVLALLPLVGLIGAGLQGMRDGSASLGADGVEQIRGTISLLIGTTLLGSLVGLMVLVPEGDPRGEAAATLTLSCGTDNQGNSYLLDRMLTTKYPLGVVLMELAHQMRLRRLILRAKWLPR